VCERREEKKEVRKCMSLKVIAIVGALALLLSLIVPAAVAGEDPATEIRFRGTVSAVGPPVMGARWWNVTVEEVLSGPQPCASEITVRVVISPPIGSFDKTVMIGDSVEVYGRYLVFDSDCEVSLNGKTDYYLHKIPPLQVLHSRPLASRHSLACSQRSRC
jgi:hypothetical protein